MSAGPFVQASTDRIAFVRTGVTYGLVKFRDRRRWMLIASRTGAATAAAYFRNEAEARDFARSFDLTITEHTS